MASERPADTVAASATPSSAPRPNDALARSPLPHSSLPIDAALPDLRAALARSNAAVLVAPPGAGKT
ncbi:hypothetical protein FV219_21160, partial [Methylobacterium sp. WL122]